MLQEHCINAYTSYVIRILVDWPASRGGWTTYLAKQKRAEARHQLLETDSPPASSPLLSTSPTIHYSII